MHRARSPGGPVRGAYGKLLVLTTLAVYVAAAHIVRCSCRAARKDQHVFQIERSNKYCQTMIRYVDIVLG